VRVVTGLQEAHGMSLTETVEYLIGLDGVRQHYTRESLHAALGACAVQDALADA
jgi:hypothetical protein